MPLYAYTAEIERAYPDHPVPDGRGVTGMPGGPPVEMDAPPADGRWIAVPSPQKTGKKDPASGNAPAVKETG